jgi:6-aminohexanoate-oligomer endohydrolase
MGAATSGENDLRPETDLGGPALEFDLPSFRVGMAEYEDGPTGCTVFEFPGGAATAIDVRGGLVGKIGDYEWNHAICLAGGSLPGLEAAAGVSAELWATSGLFAAFGGFEPGPGVTEGIADDLLARGRRAS